ncbi:MAG: YMGG-like glycine zipper-containing protein [Acidobacteriota bacterium]
MIRFMLFLLLSAGAFAQPAHLQDVVIPRKTDIFVRLERSLETRTASVGDRFYGRVTVPVTVNDQIVIPVGSYLIGQVDETERPGRLSGKAQMRLAFDTVIFPNGVTRHMEAVVQSAEGHKSGQGRQEGEIIASSSQADETVEGATVGAVAGGSVGALAGDDLKGFGVGAAVGAAGGAIVGLFRRGKHVTMARGTALTIQLENDVRFVKPSTRRGKPLRP